jgi:hypothetical protein
MEEPMLRGIEPRSELRISWKRLKVLLSETGMEQSVINLEDYQTNVNNETTA